MLPPEASFMLEMAQTFRDHLYVLPLPGAWCAKNASLSRPIELAPKAVKRDGGWRGNKKEEK